MASRQRSAPAGGKQKLRPGSPNNYLDSSWSSASSLASSAPSLAGPRMSLSNLSESLGVKTKRRRKRPSWDEAPRRTHWECMVEQQRRQFLKPSVKDPLVAPSTPEFRSFSMSAAGHHITSLKLSGRVKDVTWDPRATLPGLGKATGLGSSTGSTNVMFNSAHLNREFDRQSRIFLEPVLTESKLSPQSTRNARRLGPQDSDSWIADTLHSLESPTVSWRDKHRRRPTFKVESSSPAASSRSASAGVSRRKLHRTATSYGVAGGRGVDEVLARESARPSLAEGFSSKELARMRRAFKRFKGPDVSEVDRDDIYDIIIYLGYFSATEEAVEDIVSRVSEFSTFSFEEMVEVVEHYVNYEHEAFRIAFEDHAEVQPDDVDGNRSRCSSFDWKTPSHVNLTQSMKSGDVECSCGELFAPESKFCRHCGAQRPLLPSRLEIEDSPRGKPKGILPVGRLDEAMRALGLIPLRGVVVEVLAATGVTQSSNLDFDSFIRFMAVYRVTEGFQRQQINKAQQVFRIHSTPLEGSAMGEMEPSKLAQALIEMFGTHASAQVKSLLQKLSLTSQHEQDRDSDEEDDYTVASTPRTTGTAEGFSKHGLNCITFHEFLIWARRVHDAIVKNLQSLFMLKSGQIPSPGMTLAVDELPEVLRNMGYTLPPASQEELLRSAGFADHAYIDFDEFVRFAQVVNTTSGFTKSEVEELSDVFDKYDYNQNGEMENVELLDLLRHLGFHTGLEDVHRFLRKVDHNESGTMDLHEFLRFLRTHKEELVQALTNVFKSFTGTYSGLMPVKDVRPALASAGYEARAEALKDAMQECGHPKALSLQNFIDVADRCRRDTAEQKRKRAGFADAEFDKVRKLFTRRCKKDGKDALEYGEFLWLLIDLGMPIRTKEDRKEIFDKLRESRGHAIQAGLSESEVGEEESTQVTFWALLHFLRHFERENETRAMTKEEAAIDKARFTVGEVKDFRDIYDAWLEYSQDNDMTPATLPTDLPPSTPEPAARQRRHSLHDIFEPIRNRVQQGSPGIGSNKSGTADGRAPSRQRPRRMSVQMLLGTEPEQGLMSFEAFLVLLSSIQIQLNVREERILKDKAVDISGRDDGRIDFADFLLVMRWVTDSDLGNINFKVSAMTNRMNKAVQRISTREKDLGSPSSSIIPSPTRRISV